MTDTPAWALERAKERLLAGGSPVNAANGLVCRIFARALVEARAEERELCAIAGQTKANNIWVDIPGVISPMGQQLPSEVGERIAQAIREPDDALYGKESGD